MSVLFVWNWKHQMKVEPLRSSNEYLQLFQRPAVKWDSEYWLQSFELGAPMLAYGKLREAEVFKTKNDCLKA